MKTTVRRIVQIALVVTGLLGLFATQAKPISAQNNNEERITLSPAVLQPEFNDGQVGTGKLTVINDGTVKYRFLVYARPFSVTDENYAANYTEVNERTEAYQWIQFQKTEYTLEPGEQVEVPYTVLVPKGALGGGHYAVIFAETQPQLGNVTEVARKKRVGALLYMTIGGEVRKEGNFESLQTTFWQKKRPVSSQLRLRNTGNVHYQADINAHYKNIFGKTQFQLKQQLLVMPGTTRRIPIDWSNGPYFGVFKFGGTVSFLDKKEELPTRYILLLPYPIILAAIGIVAAAILAQFVRRRKNSSGHHGQRRR